MLSIPSGRRLSRMNNHAFAQYLLNVDKIKAEDVEDLLRKSLKAEPGTAVIGIGKSLVSQQELGPLHADDGLDEAVRDILGDDADKISADKDDFTLKTAQAMLDEHMVSPSELCDLFALYDDEAARLNPFIKAVKSVAPEDLEEVGAYGEYTRVFADAFSNYAHLPIVVMPDEFGGLARNTYFAVSQKVFGDLQIVGAIVADENMCINIAHGYSQEPIDGVDSFTIDCMMEFLNVVTGLLAVDYAKKDIDLELGAPRWADSPLLHATNELPLTIATGCGTFGLVIAGDEPF